MTNGISAAGNPPGMLTWRAKTQAARILEEHRAEERHEPVKKPLIFTEKPAAANPFDAFLESL